MSNYAWAGLGRAVTSGLFGDRGNTNCWAIGCVANVVTEDVAPVGEPALGPFLREG